MYIEQIEIGNFRTFKKTKITFCHSDKDYDVSQMPKPKLPNLNLLLANNGYGKSSFLKAIALAALGPAVGRSGIYPYRLIRREKGQTKLMPARLNARFRTHEQDQAPLRNILSDVSIIPEGDLELLEWTSSDEKLWHPVFSSQSDAFFMVGYGATRRVSRSSRYENVDKRSSPRAGRVMGLFEEEFSLRPMNAWLPAYSESRKLRGRYVQARNLLNRIVGKDGWHFTGNRDKEGEYLFERKGVEVPFPALSDGNRAFLGWLGDLLYHVCETCPSGKKLVQNKGIVMVDEIDLHLHPKWQMSILPTLAKELPNLQFIVTSHSPLIVSSLEWMNIIMLSPGPKQTSVPKRIEWAVHGLDADQILLTDFFGLRTTRGEGKKRELNELSLKARDGDKEAAKQVLLAMSSGMEAVSPR